MDKLVDILKTVAPSVATALGGPLAGVAVKAISEKLGVANTVEAITEHLVANPADVQKLQELKIEEYRIEVDDRKDARAMQIAAMQSDDPFVRRYTYYFITFWSLGAAIYIPCITFVSIPEANVRFADTILGFLLGTMVAGMFQFLLGSSLGSRLKDKK